MSIPSPTNAPTNDLIYGVEEGEFPSENEDADPPEWGKEPSMYVALFEGESTPKPKKGVKYYNHGSLCRYFRNCSSKGSQFTFTRWDRMYQTV